MSTGILENGSFSVLRYTFKEQLLGKSFQNEDFHKLWMGKLFLLSEVRGKRLVFIKQSVWHMMPSEEHSTFSCTCG